MLRTLLMTAGVMVITFFAAALSLYGLFSTCRYWWCGSCSACCVLAQARCVCTITLISRFRDDAHARSAMASELTMITACRPDCDEREFLRELQNAAVD